MQKQQLKFNGGVFLYFAEIHAMKRIGIVLFSLVLFSCKSKKTDTESGFSYESFSDLFKTVQLPYQITDADVASMKDTTMIRSAEFGKFISDSLKTKLFGRNAKIKYVALAKIKSAKNTTYYIVKAVTVNQRTALLLPFTNGQYDAAFPFLVLDDDATTTQVSSIDKSNGIVQSISQKKPGGTTAEGRNVYQYIPEAKTFTLLLTNPLNYKAEVINPIDTLPRKNKLSADYVKDKKNFVSVRDGRSPNQLMVFIHIENGDCNGEIKSEMLLTSPTTAVYRQSGDPCGLTLRFTSNSVTLKEEGGCGSRRGIDCSFDGTYPRKKPAKAKAAKKKGSTK